MMKKAGLMITFCLVAMPLGAQGTPRAPSAEEIQRQAMSTVDGWHATSATCAMHS
jgi:hypothetical protein